MEAFSTFGYFTDFFVLIPVLLFSCSPVLLFSCSPVFVLSCKVSQGAAADIDLLGMLPTSCNCTKITFVLSTLLVMGVCCTMGNFRSPY